jgi:5-methylthioadenosine/S-adenosylhomocysteine deaminase
MNPSAADPSAAAAQSVDTLIEARWVIPVRPAGAVLEDHSVAVDRGRIVALLPTAQARQTYRPKTTVRLARHALTPGFVNAHVHSAMTLLRGVGDDLPLMRWLQERIWPLEAGLVSEQFVHDGTQLAALEMLRGGVTCCSEMYFYPETAGRALRSVGLRAAVGIIAIEFPTAFASDADDYLRKGLAARDALRADPRVSFTLAPHAPYTVGDATLERIVTLAEELDLPIHMHVHETDGEIAQSIGTHGCRPLARLDRLGLVSERLIAVHAVHLIAEEIDLLAARGASVAHCPASNLKLASGIAPVAALLEAGVNVALGTDGAASNNRLDVLAELRLAALLAKGAAGDAAVLPAARALECATLAGARALGLEQRIGSIEVGKEADLAAIEFDALETQPCFDPLSHLVYVCGREHISDVWVGGDHLVQGRVVQKPQVADAGGALDSSAIEARIAAWQNSARQLLKPPS